MDIPYYALDISDKNIDKLQSNPPAHERMALATGSLCESDKERLGLCVLLAADEDKFVSKTAKRTLESWDAERLSNALHRQSHAKVIEYVVEFLPPDEKLDQTLFGCVNINDRSALLIAQRATERTCIEISKNRQQLLLNPALLNALKQNANCPEDVLSKTENFLRLQQALPSDDSVPIRTSTEASGPSADIDIDIAAEVTAALNGERSPFLNLALSSDLSMFALDSQEGGGDFSFDFNEGSAFNFDVEGEADGERKSMEQIINEMSIGHKIKLAYKGNKEAR
ncbi:MAG: hypothetical protein VX278_08475, partial [Myxococcota bacterium]|nr:hypothetical protein [Myxococcota bacterium]